MKLTQPRMYGIDGKGMWKMPSSKPFEPEGLTIGAQVQGMGRNWHTRPVYVAGQVWCQANVRDWGTKSWWIVDGCGSAWVVHESAVMVLGQCDDESLFDVEGVA